MRPPLWITVEGHGRHLTVRLARCLNCGKVKIASDPCGFDHLAALLEYRRYTGGTRHQAGAG
jgi:hypothetical protein